MRWGGSIQSMLSEFADTGQNWGSEDSQATEDNPQLTPVSSSSSPMIGFGDFEKNSFGEMCLSEVIFAKASLHFEHFEE